MYLFDFVVIPNKYNKKDCLTPLLYKYTKKGTYIIVSASYILVETTGFEPVTPCL